MNTLANRPSWFNAAKSLFQADTNTIGQTPTDQTSCRTNWTTIAIVGVVAAATVGLHYAIAKANHPALKKSNPLPELPEQNPRWTSTDPDQEELVRDVAKARFSEDAYHHEVDVFFEHDQWWVRFEDAYEDKTRTYAVVDVSGPQVIDFEEV